MAEENVVSTPSAEGDQGNTSGQQDANQSAQAAGQGQNAEPGSVDNQAQTSSANGQARSQMNFTRAQERVLERTVERMLQKALQPFSERLSQPQSPPAVTQQPVQPEIDYNDLPGSINRLVQMAAQQHLGKFEQEKLKGLDTQLDQKLSVREARSFLISQPEINGDENKMDEIQDIIKQDRILSLAVNHDPLTVVQEAVKRWKASRVNPNAPKKETLTTIAGGAAQTGGVKMPSAEELQKLQKIITSNVPESEKQAAYKRIEELQKLAA